MINKKIFEIKYAGNKIRYAFNYPATKYHFRSFITQTEDEAYDICADLETINKARKLLPSDYTDSYVEYRTLVSLTAKELLKYHCCIFHAVSFVYKGFAWLLTAPSGTGKTTQFMNWLNLFPEEISMICGDMPVLEHRSDNTIWVHPTSWNGKENLGNSISAPLKGVIYLIQDKENFFETVSIAEGIMLLLKQFISIPDNKSEVLSFSSLVDCMFTNYPICLYHNAGNNNSTILLKRKIDEYMEKI